MRDGQEIKSMAAGFSGQFISELTLPINLVGKGEKKYFSNIL